jgi:O-antigen/teichoic acid export membrane protein
MAERGSRARFVRDSAGVFGAQVLMAVVGVGTGIITARVLGPHDRGLFQLLILFPTMLSNFVKFGIPQANVYCVRRHGASLSDVASNSLWLALALGGGLAFGCYAGRDWLVTTFLRGAPLVTVPPVLLLLPFVLLQTFFQAVLQAQERFREYNIQVVAPTVLGFVGMALVLLVLRWGLVGAVVTQTAIVAGVTIWLAVRVNRTAPLRFHWNGPLARRMLTFGGKSYVQTLAATLHLRIDQYMIVMLLDPAQVGIYAIAVNLTSLLLKIADAMGTVLFPRLAALPERDAHAATTRVCRHTIFITAAVALGFATVGPFAIRLMYGHRYVGAIAPMMLLLPGIVTMSLYLILSRNFTSRNRQQVNLVAACTALIVNVSLNWFLIPRYGIAGAAVSSTVSYSLAAMVLLVMFVRESGFSVGQTVLIGRGDLDTLARAALGARRAAVE